MKQSVSGKDKNRCLEMWEGKNSRNETRVQEGEDLGKGIVLTKGSHMHLYKGAEGIIGKKGRMGCVGRECRGEHE